VLKLTWLKLLAFSCNVSWFNMLFRLLCIICLLPSINSRLLEIPDDDLMPNLGRENLRKKLDAVYADENLLAQNQLIIKQMQQQLEKLDLSNQQQQPDQGVGGSPPPYHPTESDVVGIPEVVDDSPYHPSPKTDETFATAPHPNDANKEITNGAAPPHPSPEQILETSATKTNEDNTRTEPRYQQTRLDNDIEQDPVGQKMADAISEAATLRQKRKLASVTMNIAAEQAIEKDLVVEGEISNELQKQLKLLQRMYPGASSSELLLELDSLKNMNIETLDPEFQTAMEKSNRLMGRAEVRKSKKKFGRKRDRANTFDDFSDIEEVEETNWLLIFLMLSLMLGFLVTGAKIAEKMKQMSKPKPYKKM